MTASWNGEHVFILFCLYSCSVCTYHANIRLLRPLETYSESFLSKQKCSLDLSLTGGDSQGAVSCILHCQCSIIPVSLAEVGQMVQWLQQEFCLAIICCHQQILLNNQIQVTTLNSNLGNWWKWLMKMNFQMLQILDSRCFEIHLVRIAEYVQFELFTFVWKML